MFTKISNFFNLHKINESLNLELEETKKKLDNITTKYIELSGSIINEELNKINEISKHFGDSKILIQEINLAKNSLHSVQEANKKLKSTCQSLQSLNAQYTNKLSEAKDTLLELIMWSRKISHDLEFKQFPKIERHNKLREAIRSASLFVDKKLSKIK